MRRLPVSMRCWVASWAASSPLAEEDQGDAHLADFLEVAVVGRALCQTGDDADDVQVDEVVDGALLVEAVLVGIGADDAVAGTARLVLDTVEHGGIVMGHQVGHHHADHLGRLLAQTLGKGVGTVVQPLGQLLHSLLHVLANLGRGMERPADGSDADA